LDVLPAPLDQRVRQWLENIKPVLDLGFSAAGFALVSSIEQDVDCCATQRTNHFLNVVQNSVEIWLESKAASDLRPDVVIGGPPCQPFSKSAYWSSSSAQGLADKRADCVAVFMSAIAKLRPRCFLIENVPGFVTAGGVEFVERELRRLRAKGLDYHFTWQILNCADFGVPQKRERFFGVGSMNCEFKFPESTHDDEHVTAWDALRHFKRPKSEDVVPKGKWADLIPTIPEGRNYLWHTARGGGVELFGWRTRYWSFLQKLSKAEPAPTIVATPAQDAGPFHWTNRHLSTKELAALQTFPANYQFAGDRGSRRRQIGNAVPPLMSEILARQIADHLGEPVTTALKYAVQQAGTVPKPTPTSSLPPKYLDQIGARACHPGTGKGPKPRVPTLQVATRA
jgi:DNA (cytosine-5)-methyltransferase 1